MPAPALGAAASGSSLVINVRDVQRALRSIVPDTERALRRDLRTIVGQVAGMIRSDVPTGPARGGHVSRVYTAGTRGLVPYVQWDRRSTRYPYTGWLEFGGQLPSRRSGRPARIVRPRVREGRYFYPRVKQAHPHVTRAAHKAIDTAILKAGLQ